MEAARPPRCLLFPWQSWPLFWHLSLGLTFLATSRDRLCLHSPCAPVLGNGVCWPEPTPGAGGPVLQGEWLWGLAESRLPLATLASRQRHATRASCPGLAVRGSTG